MCHADSAFADGPGTESACLRSLRLTVLRTEIPSRPGLVRMHKVSDYLPGGPGIGGPFGPRRAPGPVADPPAGLTLGTPDVPPGGPGMGGPLAPLGNVCGILGAGRLPRVIHHRNTARITTPST